MYQAKSGVKNFLFTETGYPPDLGPPPHLDLGPPYLDLDLGPPSGPGPGTPLPGPGPGTPPEQTHTCENITSRRTYVRGR